MLIMLTVNIINLLLTSLETSIMSFKQCYLFERCVDVLILKRSFINLFKHIYVFIKCIL